MEGICFERCFPNKLDAIRAYNTWLQQDVDHYAFAVYSYAPCLSPANPVARYVSLTKFNKEERPGVEIPHEFESLKGRFCEHTEIYVDASKTSTGVLCVVVSGTCTKSHSMDNVLSVFTAEKYIVMVALNRTLETWIWSSAQTHLVLYKPFVAPNCTEIIW